MCGPTVDKQSRILLRYHVNAISTRTEKAFIQVASFALNICPLSGNVPLIQTRDTETFFVTRIKISSEFRCFGGENPLYYNIERRTTDIKK